MTSSNKTEPGFYWVRQRHHDDWTPARITLDGHGLAWIEVVGEDAESLASSGAEVASRIEPPGTDYYIIAADGDTITLGASPPGSAPSAAAGSPEMVTGDGPIVGRVADLFAPPAVDARRLVAALTARPDQFELVAEAALRVLAAVRDVVGETPSAAETDRVLQAAAGLAVTIDAIGGG